MSTCRSGRLAVRVTGLAVAGVVTLAACGTDNNSKTPTSANGGTSSSGSGTSGGSGLGGAQCQQGSLMAAGSSAQKNAMDVWVSAYQKACSGATVNYQSTGSGAGVTSFLSGQVDFAGSDSALKDDEHPKADQRCASGKAVDLPMVTGPIAVAYNLNGVPDLTLDAPTIAKIFSGQITSWDDAAIAQLNGGAKLPATPIQAFHRGDESGTTDNFTKYLAAAAPQVWTFGTGKAWKAPGGQGAAKSSGVTQAVQQTDGAVTYVELSFAENAKLGVAKIDTGNGTAVTLTGDSAGKAVAAAKVVGTGDDLTLKLDYATKADGAYPIILVTYEIVCEKGLAGDKAGLAKSFLTYTSSKEGQQAIADQGYAPLPEEIRSKVADTVAKIS